MTRVFCRKNFCSLIFSTTGGRVTDAPLTFVENARNGAALTTLYYPVQARLVRMVHVLFHLKHSKSLSHSKHKATPLCKQPWPMLATNLFVVIARQTILRCPENHKVVLMKATFLLADAHEVDD